MPFGRQKRAASRQLFAAGTFDVTSSGSIARTSSGFEQVPGLGCFLLRCLNSVAAIALLSCNFARKSAHGNFGQKRKKEHKAANFDGRGIRPIASFAFFFAFFAPLRLCAQQTSARKGAKNAKKNAKNQPLNRARGIPNPALERSRPLRNCDTAQTLRPTLRWE